MMNVDHANLPMHHKIVLQMEESVEELQWLLVPAPRPVFMMNMGLGGVQIALYR